MANKVGPLIKEARTKAGLTQEALAKQIDGLTAADISKAERGEKELTQTQLRQIAKITGVTQASLLNAAKESTTAKKPATTSSTAKKPATTSSTAKKPATTSSTAKKPATSSSTAKKPTTASSSAKKPTTTAKKEEELKLTAAEKKLVELYRAADKSTKENAVKLLKGEKLEAAGLLSSLLSGSGNSGGGLLDGVSDLLGLGKK